ncbi:MAG: hypothetical protein ACM34J_11855 [Ignavibacteria bacterium]
MENDKWKMFKNFMLNELEISKEDIRNWIKEAVSEQTELLIKQTFGDFTITELIWKKFYNHFMYDYYDENKVKACIGQAIAEKIQIAVTEKKPINEYVASGFTCNNCKSILYDENCQEREKKNILRCKDFVLNKDC